MDATAVRRSEHSSFFLCRFTPCFLGLAVCSEYDIFDVYGTLDELTLFTDVVSRYVSRHSMISLMKLAPGSIYQENGWDPTNSLQIAWKSLCKTFLIEAEWFASGNMTSAKEYLENGIVSSGVNTGLVHMFFLLGEGLTKENVQTIDRVPEIISSSTRILRLWDDLKNAKDEYQEGNDGSYVDCLLREQRELSLKSARELVMSKISDVWKSLNKECLSDDTFPATFTKASLKLARMVPLMYDYDNNHSLPKLGQLVKSLFSDECRHSTSKL
ncbi:hypothetical protein Fmac_009931 [Flemingia macrophylla]|uniref:Terpene synthase metal-binding domain-containing protein n=1 Tax=Flemingia macrophylla TaxID=520843 RepID=A0ABD1N1N1_9FABA